MFNFSAIIGMFKTMLLNFNKEKATYTSEITKFLLSIGAGAWLLYMLFSFNEVPFRAYSVYIVKLFENNPKDLYGVKINIGYDEKSFKPVFQEYERGAIVHIIPMENMSADSIRNLEGGMRMANQYDSLTLSKSDVKLREAVPFIDSIVASYYITCLEMKVPEPKYKISYKNDTIVEPYATKIHNEDNKKDSVINSKKFFITKLSKVVEDGVTRLITSRLFGISDTLSSHEFHMPTSSALTSYSIFNYHDISQSNYLIRLDLPSYKNGDALKINFGGATEFSPMYPTPDRIEMSSIIYTDTEKLKIISEQGLRFNAKFKELENLQMIRLFFITTILGFLIGLFFSSLWHILLLGIDDYRKKKRTIDNTAKTGKSLDDSDSTVEDSYNQK